MRIAITGATGTIGKEIVDRALKEGHEVIAIVRPNSKHISVLEAYPQVTIIYSDITGYKEVETPETCDIFIHLAWKETLGAGRDDAAVQIDNIRYTLDAAKLAKRWGARVFVGAGSQAEFGVSNQILTSSTPTNPESGYGVAKYAAAKLCKLYCEQNDMRFNWGRITSTYGERDSDNTLMKYVIRTLLSGESPELTKCEQIWDYTYCRDTANALLLIGLHGKPGKTYVIGSGDHRSLRQFIECVRDKINPELKLKFGARPYYPHQPMLLFPDITELTEDTGYRPEYDFDEGISNVIEYVKLHLSESC